MPSAIDIILEWVVPILGVIVCNVMYLAPLRDLRTAVSEGSGLKNLNPTPWAFMLGNCIGWTFYSFLINDWFIFWSVYIGFLIACYLNLGAIKLVYSSHHQKESDRKLEEMNQTHSRIIQESTRKFRELKSKLQESDRSRSIASSKSCTHSDSNELESKLQDSYCRKGSDDGGDGNGESNTSSKNENVEEKEDNNFPDNVISTLNSTDGAFQIEKVSKTGRIIPTDGNNLSPKIKVMPVIAAAEFSQQEENKSDNIETTDNIEGNRNSTEDEENPKNNNSLKQNMDDLEENRGCKELSLSNSSDENDQVMDTNDTFVDNAYSLEETQCKESSNDKRNKHACSLTWSIPDIKQNGSSKEVQKHTKVGSGQKCDTDDAGQNRSSKRIEQRIRGSIIPRLSKRWDSSIVLMRRRSTILAEVGVHFLQVTSQKTPAKSPHENLVLGTIMVWSLILSFVGFYSHSGSHGIKAGRDIVGWTIQASSICYYAAPLSTIVTVFKTKNSDTLHVPTMVWNSINCGLWVTYGFVISDFYLCTPMGISLFFGVIQIILCVVFPKSTAWQNREHEENQMLGHKDGRLSIKYLPQSQWGGLNMSILLEGDQAENEDDNRAMKMNVFDDEGNA